MTVHFCGIGRAEVLSIPALVGFGWHQLTCIPIWLFFALTCFQHAEVEMSASLILAPGEVRDEAILWIRIFSELQALDSWGVRWTNGGMINLNQDSSHPCTNGVYPGLIGR